MFIAGAELHSSRIRVLETWEREYYVAVFRIERVKQE